MHSTGLPVRPCPAGSRAVSGRDSRAASVCASVGRWLGTVFVIAEVVDDIGDRVANEQHPFRVEQTALRVGRGKLEPFKQNLLVIREQRLLPQKHCALARSPRPGLLANIR